MTMSTTDAVTIVRNAIEAVAPDVAGELGDIDPSHDVFDALELDSMDHLNVMTEIETRTGVVIPERDYGRMRSISALADRIAAEAREDLGL